MRWLTVDKPLEKCQHLDLDTGKQCMLFAWHRGYHSHWHGTGGAFWLGSRSSWGKRFFAVTEIKLEPGIKTI